MREVSYKRFAAMPVGAPSPSRSVLANQFYKSRKHCSMVPRYVSEVHACVYVWIYCSGPLGEAMLSLDAENYIATDGCELGPIPFFNKF